MADQVMPALVKRRADLMGELEKAQGHVQQLHADLASLSAVAELLRDAGVGGAWAGGRHAPDPPGRVVP